MSIREDSLPQRVKYDTKSASSRISSTGLVPAFEIAFTPDVKAIGEAERTPDFFTTGRFSASLQDSPDTAYERTVNSIYDSYATARGGIMGDARPQDDATTAPYQLNLSLSPPRVVRHSSKIPISKDLGIPDDIDLNTTAPVSPPSSVGAHRTTSNLSFASGTGLLHDHPISSSAAERTPQVRPRLFAANRTSEILPSSGELSFQTAQVQRRATLHRQGTDDLISSTTYARKAPPLGIIPYTGDASAESDFDGGKDTKDLGELGVDSEKLRGGVYHGTSTGNAQLISARNANRWKRLLPGSKWGFLILVITETLINIAIEGNLLFRFNHAIDSNTATSIVTQNKVRLPIYLSIFAMAHFFQLILAIDATIFRNTIQIIGLSIFNGLFLVYAVIQMDEIKDILGTAQDGSKVTGETAYSVLHVPVTVQTAIILGVIAAAQVGFLVLSWFIYKDFGWEIYKDLGADLNIKRYYLHHQIFVCVIRFASFFFVGFGVQFIFLILPHTDPEYYITIAALPVSILLLVIGALGAHFENIWAMGGFLFGMLGGLGYFVFKTYRIYNQRAVYHQVYKSLTTFSGLSMLILAVSLVWACIVMRNFGKGLREQRARAKVRKRKARGKRDKQSTCDNQHEMEVARRRMTLE